MQLDLTDDQVLFHETTVRFIEAELPLSRTRELHDDAVGYDRGWLGKAAELGWFTMLVPEDRGGGSVSGAGILDAAIVAEEMGRHGQPGPFLAMNLVASALSETAGHQEVLDGIVAGEVVATWAFADGGGAPDDGSGVQAVLSGDGLALTGRRGFVQDAQSAEWLLVPVTLDGEPAQVLVPAHAPGVTITPLATLDLVRRMAHVDLDGVVVDQGAVVSAGPDALERLLQRMVVLLCADTVGAMDALFTMTVAYAKDRVAFGRPVGSFQSLKHVMADQALYLEACKAGAVAAARAVEAGDDDAAEVVSMVAAYIGDQGNELAQECLQIHGGIGYTWEHDLHLLLRRIRSNTALAGEPTWHRERVCSFHSLGQEMPA